MDARSRQEAPTDLLVAVRPTEIRRRRRSATTGPGRRPALLLAAALAGGIAAAVVGVHGAPQAAAGSTSVAEAQQALLAVDEGLEVKPQASVTLAEAQARLQEVAASRAARAEADAAAAEAARPKAVFPIDGSRLTSAFGPRWGTLHRGIDLAAPMLTPEYAAVDGVVLRAGAASGFGLAVYILTENGDVMVYGHMEKITVEAGEYVAAGDTVALVGNRGQSTGPHLHFEIRKGGENGTTVDPMAWLAARGVDVDSAV